MIYPLSEIRPIAEKTGFNIHVVEKVVHLLDLLNMINSHPVLKGKLALKGGTALNLYIFDMPRLSVDIDLNYIGALDLKEMTADRPKVEQALTAVFQREGFIVKRVPTEHAGGKWILNYRSCMEESANLEVDLNYMFRQPLWDVGSMDSHRLGNFQAKNIPVFSVCELFAGKLAALFSRHQTRDLFDAHQLLNYDKKIDLKDLRLAFVVYGAMNRKDWRTISLEDISFDPVELKQQLLQVLQLEKKEGTDRLGQSLVKECHQKLSCVFPLLPHEIKFLDLICEKGEIEPSLLTSDKDLQERVKRHPMLLWKAMNVRKHSDGI